MREIQRYNWVDAESYAETIFSAYSYEICWIRDAWNLLMFEKPIIETNIISSNLENYSKADILLWLLAMYDLFYDYQITLEHQEGYGEFEQTTADGYTMIAYNAKDLSETLQGIDQWKELISTFFQRYIRDALDEVPAIIYGDWDIEDCNEDEERVEEKFPYYRGVVGFISQILNDEIASRRSIITKKISSYFSHNTTKIMSFMAGYHFLENYTDYKKRLSELEDNKRKLLNSKDDSTDVDEVEWEHEENIKNLVAEYRAVSIDEIDKYFYGENDVFDVMETYEWIENGMEKLC